MKIKIIRAALCCGLLLVLFLAVRIMLDAPRKPLAGAVLPPTTPPAGPGTPRPVPQTGETEVAMLPAGRRKEAIDRRKQERDAWDEKEEARRDELEREARGEEEEEDGMMEAMEQEYRRTRSPLTGDVPNHHLMEVIAQRNADRVAGRTNTAISGVTWTERGPSNVGGRTRALHFDLNDATYKKVWAGSVAGGMWYTSDITASTITWTKVNDFLDNLAVTTIAQSPANKQYLYAGTGEGWYNTDAIRGGGIFRSTDGGANWSALSSTSVSSLSSTFSYVQKIVVTSGGVVLAATKYGGLERSTDNGTTWSRVLGNSSFSGTSAWGSVADIEIGADGTIYASTGILYTGGVYRSTDNGATWTQIYTAASDEQRIELAPAPSSAGTVYALVQQSDNSIKKVMYTTNATATTPSWTDIADPSWCDQGTTRTDFTRGQAWYDLTAAVDPNDATTVYVGGVDVLKYNTGTSTWTQVSQWASGCSSRPYVHADIHALVFKPSTSTELLVGCDGGIYRTADGGSSFTSRNNGFNVTQFYSVAPHPTNENYFLAGAQDNGTHKFTTSGVNSTSQASGGDGGFCHIDKTNSNIQISSYVYNYYYVSTNGGSSFTSYNKNSNGQFINPWDYDDTNDILYASSSSGTFFRWSSPATNGTSGEVSVSAFGSAKVTTVAVSPSIANRVYFGLDNGSVIMVDNANGTPTTTTIRTGSGSVSCVAVNSSDENKMLVTYSNYDVTNVYYSSNGTSASATWTGIDGNLGNMPVRWALFDPRSSSKAFIATELGVWSTDAINGSSTSWGSTNGGLANVRVDMLQYNASTMTLAAATHGRGLYTAVLCGSSTISTQPTAQSVCTGAAASFSVTAAGAGLSYQWRKGGSNISGATSSSYSIAAAAATDAGSYDVVVSGTCGNVTSSAVALTVSSTSITSQPTAQTVCAGSAATFTVAASGLSLSYQWRKGGTNISGATSASYTIASTTTADAGTFDVVITGTCGSVTSSAVALTVNSSSITTQPSALSVCTGASATFSVVASGGSLSYQWKKNGTNISGATSSSYSIASVAATDVASYTVTVTGSCGSVTSSAAALTIGSTAISTQPTAQTVCAGSSASFTVAASGSGLSYQWRKGGSNITGATSATYTIASASAADAASYDVVVTNACGSATSNAVALTLTTATAIATQPTAQTVCAGSAATFSVAATGASLSYQWKKAGTNISGATSSSYTLASTVAADAASYSVIVSGTCGSVTSSSVALTVNTATSISTQPSAQSACAGSNASFSVTASGTALAYQWRKGGTNISGATSSTLSLSSVGAADAASYDVVVTGSCGSVTSSAATLTVNATTAIGTQPGAQAVCIGGSPIFTVSASGTSLGYQWKKDGNSITGATASSYFINNVAGTDAGSYTVTVTGGCGSETSSAALLTVNSGAAISTQPVAQTVCAGSAASFSVTATGAGLSYQWKKNGSAISGATGATYSIASAATADAGTYSVTVSGTCGNVTSSGVLLTVRAITAISVPPSNSTVCAGLADTLYVTATGTSLTYQWKKNGADISGATQPAYIIPAATAADAATYTVSVSGTCGAATSAGATLTVNASTAISTQPVASQALCPGGNLSLSVVAVGTGTLTYQWKKDGSTIAGATSANYVVNGVSAAHAGTYSVVVSGDCGIASSGNAMVTINTATSINTQPAAATVCAGSAASFTADASGSGTLSYQWKKDGASIAGATAATYSIASSSAASAGSYAVDVTGTCGTLASAAAVLTVNGTTTIATQPASQSVCAGASATFTVGATGAGLSYQWKKGGTDIPGATSGSYTIASAAAADAASYSVTVTGSCGSATSSTATLTIPATTAITTQPSAQAVCAGSPASLTVAAAGTGLTYQWRRNGITIGGATAATYTILSASAAEAGSYDVVVTGTCGTRTSAAVTLTVNPQTVVTTAPVAQSACIGSSASFTVAASGTSLSYQWKKDGTNIGGATSATLSLPAVTAGDAGGYSVAVTGTCGTVTTTGVTLTVVTATTIGTQPAAQAVCGGSTATFTVAASGSGLAYQWKKDGVTISGATASTYSVVNAAAANAGNYSVAITGSCGNVSSNAVALTVNAVTTISTQPASVAVCTGSGASFTVAATGSGTLSYQWKKDGTGISGATNASYAIGSTVSGDAGSYTVAVSGTCGSVTSGAATLTVPAATVITTQPASLAACAGAGASFSVTATGAGLGYQWRKGGSNISGATSATLTLANVTAADAANYDVMITGTCGSSISSAATLTVPVATSITTAPIAQTTCPGNPVTFSVAATGSSLSYQWKKDGSDIAGATSAAYTIASASAANAGSYSVIVTGTCGSSTSAAATLTVNNAPAIGTQPVAQTVCAGANVSFTIAATGAGLSYQWRKGGSNIAGANTATLSLSNAVAGDAASYDVVVTGNCGSVTSANAALTVNAPIAITSQPVAQVACPGNSASFTVGAAGTSPSYQWRKDGVTISGATAATYTIIGVVAADAGSYSVVVTGTCGSSTSSGAALVTSTAAAITTQPVAQRICQGGTVTFAVSATGTSVAYQWKKDGVNIAGATSATLSIGSVTSADAASYSVAVSNSCGSTLSAGAQLTVDLCTAVSRLDADVSSSQLLPNRVADVATLRVTARHAVTTRWTIYDATGRAVQSFTRSAIAGTNDFRLQLGALAGGTYYLVGQTDKGPIGLIRLVRE